MPYPLLRFQVQPFVMRAFTVALMLALALVSPPALAEPVAPELLAKLAVYGQAFEAEMKRASYRVEGKMEILDGDGKPSETQELVAKVDANGGEPKITVLKYLEDGKDKTADAVKESQENAAKRKKRHDDDKELKMPILASQQPRYDFDEVERSADGRRVKIHFAPKSPADDTTDGSAWVDADAGTIVSASFRLSKTSMFIKYIHVIVEFAAQTSLGPAVSKVSIDGEGGILFFRRRFRGAATLSDYSIAP